MAQQMNRTSIKQKITLIMFGLFFAILLSEGLFRVAGLFVEPEKNIHRINTKYFKILCLGDSVTYGVGSTNRARYSYPSHLQRILSNKNSDREIQVINYGMPGMNSSQLLNRLENNILEIKPQLIIIMIGMNDSWNFEESNVLKFFNESVFENLYLVCDSILNRLKLYKFVKLLFVFDESIHIATNHNTDILPIKEYKAPLQWSAAEAKSKSFNISLSSPAKGQALYLALRENILKIAQVTESYQIPLIFMKYHSGGLGRPDRALNMIYDEINAHVVDNEAIFKKARKLKMDVKQDKITRIKGEATTVKGWHPNDLGYLLIAKNIYNKMVSMKLINSDRIDYI
jgi:hypothetical protein